jgi:hypothetical protein
MIWHTSHCCIDPHHGRQRQHQLYVFYNYTNRCDYQEENRNQSHPRQIRRHNFKTRLTTGTLLYILCTCCILFIRIPCSSSEMNFPVVVQVVESFMIHAPLHVKNYHRITLLRSSDNNNKRYNRSNQKLDRKNTAAIPMSPSPTYSTNNNNKIKWDIPKDVKLLILPGFGNDMEDYRLSYNQDRNDNKSNNSITTTTTTTTTSTNSGSLIQSFVNRGWVYNENVYVVPIQRIEWINVFLYGIMDIQFLLYSNAPPTNPAFFWYLQRIITTIQQQMTTKNHNESDDNKNDTKPTKIVFIGHSAGGWLGRAAMGYICTNTIFDSNSNNIILNGIVTLGTPNLAPPMTEMDMTRGALRYTNTYYPDAYQHYQNTTTITTTNENNNNNNTIFYITVCGDTVQGIEQVKQSWMDWIRPPSTTMSGFAYNSYKAVCGNGTMIGDGVVPLCSAHLQNAIQITIPNIYHSINVPDQWYGTETVIDEWYNVMMEQILSSNRNDDCNANVGVTTTYETT